MTFIQFTNNTSMFKEYRYKYMVKKLYDDEEACYYINDEAQFFESTIEDGKYNRFKGTL